MDSQDARRLLVGLSLACAACATLADAETGGANLPNAAAGPFRVLRSEEVGSQRVAPNVIVDDQTFPRDVTILDADGDPATPGIIGFFAANPFDPMLEPDPLLPSRTIVRHEAVDGRSFDRTVVTVLVPEQPWEGATVGAPSALRVGAEVFLYYSAEGGIGLARSTDGLQFTHALAPVLGPNASGWENGKVPGNPGVVRLGDGSFRMLYDVTKDDQTRRIGEARSADGVVWERVGNAPALEPQMDTNPADPTYDGIAVEAPYPVLTQSSEGRSVLRVYYGARDALGRRSIGLAARYDPTNGTLERAVGPVFASSLGPGQPCVDVRPGYTLLFVTQFEGTSEIQQIPAVAAGVSPADAVLPVRAE